MGKLIIIEGTDGSGKQTQSQLLHDRLYNKGIKVKKISFPDYESPSSSLVKMYLNGDFGKDAQSVNAYAASSFYGVDRYASFKTKWEKEYENGYVIISDRYTTSNIVHQSSKIDDFEDKMKCVNWIEDFEYNKLGIPSPDLVVFLNVPIEYTFNLMENRENKITGEKSKDIHESNKEYLIKSYNSAIELAKLKGWIIIDCVKDGKMRTIEDINDEIYRNIEVRVDGL